jgi:hypothetical protein
LRTIPRYRQDHLRPARHPLVDAKRSTQKSGSISHVPQTKADGMLRRQAITVVGGRNMQLAVAPLCHDPRMTGPRVARDVAERFIHDGSHVAGTSWEQQRFVVR